VPFIHLEILCNPASVDNDSASISVLVKMGEEWNKGLNSLFSFLVFNDMLFEFKVENTFYLNNLHVVFFFEFLSVLSFAPDKLISILWSDIFSLLSQKVASKFFLVNFLLGSLELINSTVTHEYYTKCISFVGLITY